MNTEVIVDYDYLEDEFDQEVDGPELDEDFYLDDYEPDLDSTFEWESSMSSIGWGTDEDYSDWDYANDY